jgi:hypothetical protein
MQNRRVWLSTVGSGALVSLLSPTRRTMAQATSTKAVPTDPFILLLRGVYVPITDGPNLGLQGINLDDGTFSRTRIYPVFGIPGADNEDENEHTNVAKEPVGNFYVRLVPQTEGNICAFDLPGGAIAMEFLSGGFTPHDDGVGGQYLEGTFELTITDATGIYKDFKGGHDHMVDRLHQLASGRLDEFCFCVISQYPFP